jgi:2TM domain
MTDSISDPVLRAIAKKSLKKKRDFKQYLGIWFAVSVILTAIWAMSGGGYYWPIWAIFGMGIGAFFAGMDAYGKSFNKPISESEIDAEVKRLTGL